MISGASRAWRRASASMRACSMHVHIDVLRPVLTNWLCWILRRPIHAGSRFDGDFNDKIAALKRKPIQTFDSPKGPSTHVISPHGSPLRSIGIFRQARTRFDNDEGFSKKVKSALL